MTAPPSAMPNRLAHETSPYLQQHADNPVDWYPWGEDALRTARESDHPILLSVGYSACHWCHVMAHECFEDEDTAALMNANFVNIKVDREERPDIDQIYQTAHQLIARGAGGWPLTMFLTPDGKPFYGGTYFPKLPRYGRPGFDQLLARVGELWKSQRSELVEQGEAIVRALENTVRKPSAAESRGDAADSVSKLDDVAVKAGTTLIDSMMQTFDARHGGFGRAPKFPQPSTLSALLRHAVAAHDDRARDAALLTLRRMGEGGIFDQLGGGFCRYSTDERWLIPHFEKMLYDNGPLLRLYAEAWQLTHEPLFREICEGTAAWLIREMQSPEGGYTSSFDADSEGEEGKFYVWDKSEVAAQLTTDEFKAFAARYGLDEAPNFEGHAWNLHVARPIAEVAAIAGLTEADAIVATRRGREKLASLRESRVWPSRDDKILTSWNALAIDGMLFASRVFGRPAWAASATRALDFIRTTLWRDGRLLATCKDGRAHLNAYLDDHAFLLGALIESMQMGELRPDDVAWAREIAELLLSQFEDRDHGGFFFTSHDHEKLVLRNKPGYDNATASGNGSAALYLQRFGCLVGDHRYVVSAERTMAMFAPELTRIPHAFGSLVTAMTERAQPPAVVVISAPTTSEAAAAEWQSQLAGRYAPGLIAVRVGSAADALPGALVKPTASHVQAWICKGAQCLPPVSDLRSMMSSLD